MISIDYILDLLSWNSSKEDQEKGLELARTVKNFYVFIQPVTAYHSKDIWDNCAKILSEKSDEELKIYLVEMFNWIQDLNWPGSFCILDRLKEYKDISEYKNSFDSCMKCAEALDDEAWIYNLNMVKKD